MAFAMSVPSSASEQICPCTENNFPQPVLLVLFSIPSWFLLSKVFLEPQGKEKSAVLI
jgi:hypothetical protein